MPPPQIPPACVATRPGRPFQVGIGSGRSPRPLQAGLLYGPHSMGNLWFPPDRHPDSPLRVRDSSLTLPLACFAGDRAIALVTVSGCLPCPRRPVAGVSQLSGAKRPMGVASETFSLAPEEAGNRSGERRI